MSLTYEELVLAYEAKEILGWENPTPHRTKRDQADLADISLYRQGKLSGMGLLFALKERGKPKLRKQK